MFSFIFQAIQNYIEKTRRGFSNEVHYIMNENVISYTKSGIQKQTNDMINEATISSQKTMIERTLKEREIKLDETLKPQRDIQKAKDTTKEDLYKTLRQKQKEKNENEKSKKREEHTFTK